MQAVRFSRFGAATEVAELVDLPEPAPPGPGEVVIDILASPINPSDFLNFEGRFGAYAPVLPAFAGGEAVGRVAALGAGVSHLRVGDRVLALYAGRGNWRERVKTAAAPLFALPSEADTLQLAMLAVNPATAWHMLNRFVALKPGDFVLQNAGNSGVGQNVITLARKIGARTISIVRRQDQVGALKAIGADAVLVDGPGLVAAVAEASGGAPIPLAFDAVAGEATRRLANSVAPGGTVVIYGLLSSGESRIDASDVLFRDVSIRGFWLSAWFAQAEAAEKRTLYSQLGALVADGTIDIAVEAAYPLARIKDALTHAARPGRMGKIVLVMNQ
jgi:NADPH:quinone reductase-like Zn-dependent oxidoreductase